MVIITNYSDDLIRINNNDSEIFFLNKSDLEVSGVGGRLVLTNSTSQYTYLRMDIKVPSSVTLDDLLKF